jgi:cobyrinic acid a,c-diamide synthase
MAAVIAGERSGSGKTTITLALLAALRAQGRPVQSFKVGPDYIDPMFHAHVTGRPCYNLDMVLTSAEYVPRCFASHTQGVELAVVEGVMGLFDGAADPAGYGSTAQVARHLDLPVILVVNCQSMSQSVAALVQGYCRFDPQLQIAGLVLNRVGSDRHLEILTAALAPLQISILGVFRREDAISLPDRYLGLVPTAELLELRAIVDRLAVIGQQCFDWEKLLPLLQVSNNPTTTPTPLATRVKIGVAWDEAFSFYYAENLAILESLGAELCYWSPLRDQVLPAVHGLYFGGGFPEMFAVQLAANKQIRAAVRSRILAGMPTYAECGGLMYLTESIINFEGCSYPMVGVLPTQARMGQRLTLGYRTAVAQVDTPLLLQGELVRGHEFHRSSLSLESSHPVFQMQRRVLTALPSADNLEGSYPEGWHLPQLHASYLHLHWGNQRQLPARFIQQCLDYSVRQDHYS